MTEALLEWASQTPEPCIAAGDWLQPVALPADARTARREWREAVEAALALVRADRADPTLAAADRTVLLGEEARLAGALLALRATVDFAAGRPSVDPNADNDRKLRHLLQRLATKGIAVSAELEEVPEPAE